MSVFRGFKNFLMQGDLIVIAVGLVIALAFLIVVPYRAYAARRGHAVFGEPAPTRSCPECLSDDLPAAARKCNHCGSALAAA